MSGKHGPDDWEWLESEVSAQPAAAGAYDDAVVRDSLLDMMATAREVSGLSQKAVAAAMGTTQSAISELLSGHVDARVSTLQRYARATGHRLSVQLSPSGTRTVHDDGRLGPILAHILQLGTTTVSGLAERLRVPAEFVSPIVERLKQNRWVERSGRNGIRVNYDRASVAGFSIRRRHVTGVLSDLRGQVVLNSRTIQLGDQSPKSVVAAVSDAVHSFQDAMATNQDLLGIGVELAGVVDAEKGVVHFAADFSPEAADQWRDFDLQDALEAEVGAPVTIENDANALAMCEYIANGDAGSIIVLLLSEGGLGIGAGLVHNGEVVRGHSNAAGEIGHVIVVPDGPPCRSGRHQGCLESLASADAIVRSALRKSANSELSIDEALEQAALLASEKADEAVDAFRSAGTALGQVLSKDVAMLDPQRLVVYGQPQLVLRNKYVAADIFLSALEETLESVGFVDKSELEPKVLDELTSPRAMAATAAHRLLSTYTVPVPKAAKSMPMLSIALTTEDTERLSSR